jgi:hypothetical protein
MKRRNNSFTTIDIKIATCILNACGTNHDVVERSKVRHQGHGNHNCIKDSKLLQQRSIYLVLPYTPSLAVLYRSLVMPHNSIRLPARGVAKSGLLVVVVAKTSAFAATN